MCMQGFWWKEGGKEEGEKEGGGGDITLPSAIHCSEEVLPVWVKYPSNVINYSNVLSTKECRTKTLTIPSWLLSCADSFAWWLCTTSPGVLLLDWLPMLTWLSMAVRNIMYVFVSTGVSCVSTSSLGTRLAVSMSWWMQSECVEVLSWWMQSECAEVRSWWMQSECADVSTRWE